MKRGNTIDGTIQMVGTIITEKNSKGIQIYSFATENAAKEYFNKRRLIKRGTPRLHRREVAVIYYSQTII